MVALRYIQTAFANFHSFLAQWRSSLGFSGLLASVSAVMSHGDLSKMTRSALAYDASKGTIRTDIAKFFADGKFARPVKDFSAFANELTKVLKTSMVSTALLSANVYVLRNAHTRNNCEKNNGRMLKIDTADELCYTLEWPGKGRKGLHWNQIPERNDLTQIVDKDMLDNVVAKVYEASAEEIIHGSVYCQAKTGEYNGAQELEPTEAVPGGGKWPKCFWNLPVFTLDPKDILTTTPCRIYFDNPDNKKVGDLGKGFLPDHLAQVFNKDFCEPADCGIPGCEGNKRRSARDFTF
ncbi:hypothetical protein BKA63DRAFT_38003 [Paraphoma chrysanthemicola]|nr:hypothetical protein BKA63DRAFT_38003 [Paraphoma chrysanthemicola]